MREVDERRQGLALAQAQELIDRELAEFERAGFERIMSGHDAGRERDAINGIRQFRDILAGFAKRAQADSERGGADGGSR
jgi:hypothetical protein